MTSAPPPIVQMANITKSFPGGVLANDDISLSIWARTTHAVIGENGAGKSTLMNILYGRYQPDRGRIRMHGKDVRIESPARAIALGIGIVTQHTTMIPALSVIENVILGAEPTAGGILDRAGALRRVEETAEKLGLTLDWNAPTARLSVAALQKAEIVKALYHGASILILDEPTATLAPQEAEALFELLRSLVDSGSTVIFVTHKLREVMAHSDRISVLRGGRLAGERLTSQTYPEDLLGLMLGHRVTMSPGVPLGAEEPERPDTPMPWERGPESELLAPPPESTDESEVIAEAVGLGAARSFSRGVDLSSQRAPSEMSATPAAPMLEVESLRVFNDHRALAVKDVTLSIAPGEVLGVAGVDGSGQRELAEAIIGLRRPAAGRVILDGEDVSRLSVARRMRRGIAYIPEDRQREGLILDFTLAENLLLGRQRAAPFGGGRALDLATIDENGERAIRTHRIRAPGADAHARTLSGGNQQKLVIARALEGSPRLLVAMQPTRGLDVDATRFVYSALRAAQSRGMAILLFSLDLDEVFEMSDRIAVMYSGVVVATVAHGEATPEDIGRSMVEGRG